MLFASGRKQRVKCPLPIYAGWEELQLLELVLLCVSFELGQPQFPRDFIGDVESLHGFG